MRHADFFIADVGIFDQAGLNDCDIFRLGWELAVRETPENCN